MNTASDVRALRRDASKWLNEMLGDLEKISRAAVKQKRTYAKAKREATHRLLRVARKEALRDGQNIDRDEVRDVISGIAKRLDYEASLTEMEAEEYADYESRRRKFFRSVARCRLLGRTYVTTGEFEDPFEPPAGS